MIGLTMSKSVLLISLFISLLFNNSLALADDKPSPAEQRLYSNILEDDIVMGDAKAPVLIIEYSSLSCPHCAYFHQEVLQKLKEAYINNGKVKYVHRDFPLDKQAVDGAKLIHCAGKDRYYLYLKVLFEKQNSWVMHNNYIEILENIAKLGGLSGEKFHSCLNDNNLEQHILAVRLKATKIFDIKATPTFIINGEMFNGAQNFEFFKDKIEAKLKKVNK
jgi:protein-disulfide isomerase